MENIIEPSDKFDFSKLNLENPVPLQGGNFFTKLNFSDKQLPLLVQLPKCNTKHGLIKTQSSKKSYTDLLFNYFETDVLTWLENLEIKCRELIFSKKDIWFQTEMDLDDIENMFISPAKSFKSGKFITVRAYIPFTKHIKKEYCLIYDENERSLDASAINETATIIPLINIEGIKFSSKSFQLEINLRQIMVLSIEDQVKHGCLIKHNGETLDKEDNEQLDNNLSNLSETKTLEEETNSLEEEKDSLEEEKDSLEEEKNSLEEEKNSLEEEKNSLEIVLTPEQSVNSSEKSIEKSILNVPINPVQKLKTTILTNEDKKKDVGNENSNFENQDANNLLEVDLSIDNIDDNVSLKKPNEVYLEIWKSAREKAKHMKQATIEAYLEARNIKTKFMLDELNPSDDESDNSMEFEE